MFFASDHCDFFFGDLEEVDVRKQILYGSGAAVDIVIPDIISVIDVERDELAEFVRSFEAVPDRRSDRLSRQRDR